MSKLIDADFLVESINEEIAAHKDDKSVSDLMTKALLRELIKILNDLPAAEDWERYSTKLWKEAYERGKRDAQPTQTNTPNTLDTLDCVSRQAAIDAIRKYDFFFPQYAERFVTELRDAMKSDLANDIKALPAAQSSGWLETHVEEIMQAGYEGREVEFRINGRAFRIREVPQ